MLYFILRMKAEPGGTFSAIPTVRALDPIKDKELFDKALRFVSKGNTESGRVQITKLETAKGGFYRAYYLERKPWMTKESDPSKETALLDLEFPLSEESMVTLVARCREEAGAQLFLSFGPGIYDYPKRSDLDPKEGGRIFFVVDEGYGFVMGDQEKERESRDVFSRTHYISSKKLDEPLPEKSYLFNGMSWGPGNEDAFDIVQAANVISEPRKFGDAPDQIGSFVKMIKPRTGELFLLETSTPSAYSLKRVQREVADLGCSIEVLFFAENPETEEQREAGQGVISEDLIARLKRDYHISDSHFYSEIEKGSYAAIIRKPEKENLPNT